MRDYELVMVWNPELGEEATMAALDRLGGVVAQNGGEVADTNVWGRRRLAYFIDRHTEGIYIVQQLRMTPESTTVLDNQLKLNEDVLRHLLVRKEA